MKFNGRTKLIKLEWKSAMDESTKKHLQAFNRISQILWGAIFAGVCVLMVVAYMIQMQGYLTEAVFTNESGMKNLIMLITIALLFLIIVLKRSFLIPEKIIDRAGKQTQVITGGDLAVLIHEHSLKGDLLAKSILLLRRYQLIIWSIAEAIVVIGFVVFILTLQFRTFIMYSVIGLYSLAINFPSFSLPERIHLLIFSRES